LSNFDAHSLSLAPLPLYKPSLIPFLLLLLPHSLLLYIKEEEGKVREERMREERVREGIYRGRRGRESE